MDGHSAHTKNLEAIELAWDRGLILISLSAHTTHRLQPLDVSFFKPLSVYFNQAFDKWMWAHSGRNIIQFQISELFGEAYGRAATAVSGFAETGIWPTDPNVFNDSDFVSLQDPENENCVASLQGTTDRNPDDCQNTFQCTPSLCSPTEVGVK